MSGVYLALLEATGGHGLAKVAIYSPMQPRVAMASRRHARARARARGARAHDGGSMRGDRPADGTTWLHWAVNGYLGQPMAPSSPQHAHATGTRRFLAFQHCLTAAVAKWTHCWSGWAWTTSWSFALRWQRLLMLRYC